MHTEMGDRDLKYVAAIDFGTTYSGYAFSEVGSKDFDGKRKIFMNNNWGENVGCQMYKTPTCLLLDAEGQFDSFGFEAEEKFSIYVQSRQENTCMYFKNFKMELHKNHKAIKPDMNLKATNGRQYPAIEVFTHSLRYLSDHVKEALSTMQGSVIQADSIRWVITVPAIWNNAAKQFMRKSAYKAGLASEETKDRLLIALEPEAASICCADHGDDGEAVSPNPARISVGTKYMVVDCGGGTVDITTHEMIEGGYINELHHPTGGPWGGDRVNNRFVDLWNQIFGEEIMDELRESYPMEWNEYLRAFEVKKRGMSTKINIHLRHNLSELIRAKFGNNFRKAIASSGVEDVRFSNGIIVMGTTLVERLFGPIIEKIIILLKRLRCSPKLKDVTHMVLVGGFSEAQLLQRRVKEEFERENFHVLVYKEAGLFVVKGAVEFGFSPTKVQVRVPALTYGIRTLVAFDEKKNHPAWKRVWKGGRYMCTDNFVELVEAGTSVKLGETKKHEGPLKAVSDDQTHATVYLYSTTEKGAKFTTDEGMSLCGVVKVDMPDTSGGKERDVEVYFTFGGTEIEVEARDVTSGMRKNISIDFHA